VLIFQVPWTPPGVEAAVGEVRESGAGAVCDLEQHGDAHEHKGQGGNGAAGCQTKAQAPRSQDSTAGIVDRSVMMRQGAL